MLYGNSPSAVNRWHLCKLETFEPENSLVAPGLNAVIFASCSYFKGTGKKGVGGEKVAEKAHCTQDSYSVSYLEEVLRRLHAKEKEQERKLKQHYC